MVTRLEWTVEAAVRLAKVCIIMYTIIYDLIINRYWYYNYSYFKVLARILLYTKYQTQGVSWTLSSNCASNREVAFNVKEDQFYEEECALEIGGSYELSCNSYTGKGWSGALLLIENKAYCQNFREGFNEVTTIKITGK